MFNKLKNLYSNNSSKKLLYVILVAVIFLSFLLSRALYISYIRSVGVKTVMTLYNFDTVTELNSNMDTLSNLCTSDVYNTLTIDNIERTLNTYLKFKQDAVKVEVLESNTNYVLYTLHTKSLSVGRKFMFVYTTDFFGKISKVSEYEVIPFR